MADEVTPPKPRKKRLSSLGLTFTELKNLEPEDLPQPVYSPRPLSKELSFPPQYQNEKRVSLDGNYSLAGDLGSGISGQVFIGKHKETGEPVAVKKINKSGLSADALIRVQREYAIMKHASHPNIIKLLEVIENPEEINIVMELAPGGDLYSHIIKLNRPLTEEEAAHLFVQICDAICYLHKIGFIHRDIKPENILLNATHDIPTVADLGYSAPFAAGETTTARCGSVFYAAPEVLKRKEYTGPEVDIWSLGVLLYVMTCGRLPFYDPGSEKKTIKKIYKGSFSMRGIPPLLCDMLSRMLVLDPTKRLTIEEVLEHPWLHLHVGDGYDSVSSECTSSEESSSE